MDLEKKLAKKERELEELRKMLSSNVKDELKREILKEVEGRLRELESKVVELSKTIENILSDILYLKSELKVERKPKKRPMEVERKESDDEVKDDGELIVVD